MRVFSIFDLILHQEKLYELSLLFLHWNACYSEVELLNILHALVFFLVILSLMLSTYIA